MKVITPVQVDSSNLISTSVTEIQPAWSNATTYSDGQIVSYLDFGIYESLQDSNLNNPPDSSPLYWLRLGPTNKLAMFDNQVSTASTATTSLTFTVKTGFFDSIALLNLTGVSVTVIVRDTLGGNIVYEVTQSLQGDDVYDWYQYFFFPVDTQRTQAIFQGIPSLYGDSHTTITLTGAPAATVGLGSFIFGSSTKLGNTEYNVNSGIIDFSVKNTDEFGETTFVKRAFSKRMNAKVYLANTDLNRVQRVLYNLRATPALWIGSDDPLFEEPLIVYGFYREFSTDIAYPSHSYCNLEIEGLI